MKNTIIIIIGLFFALTAKSQNNSHILNPKICLKKNEVILSFGLINKAEESIKYYLPNQNSACIGVLKLYSKSINHSLIEIPICSYIVDFEEYVIDSNKIFSLDTNEIKKIKIIFKDKFFLQSFKINNFKTIFLELNYDVFENKISDKTFYSKKILSQKVKISKI